MLIDLAHRIANGEVRAVDVIAEWQGRLETAHAATNCVAAWNPAALDQAAELDQQRAADGPVGPLHGVPITIKDWIDVAGMPCTGGEAAHRDRVPARDATVAARLRAAGAVVLAKTAVQVDSELFGVVRHPLAPERSPGGSSSGEGAAVGAGGSPIGVGSDSGGSIRVPAAWCGLAGLKPSAGRVSTVGHFPHAGERLDGRTQIGPIAWSVRDLAAVLPIIAGPDGLDAGLAPVPLGDPSAVSIRGLRVGWALDAAVETNGSIVDAGHRAVDTLIASGAEPAGEILQHFDEAMTVTLGYWQRRAGRLSGWDVDANFGAWDRYRFRMLRAHADVDVVVMPATTDPAPLHREMTVEDYRYTLPASLTGAPAVVLPMGSAGGLPVAVQVTAARWDDDIALAAAIAIEDGRS